MALLTGTGLPGQPTGTAQVRLWTALVSVSAALLILLAKFLAWHLTGSTAMLSDALESIVNVVAAGFAVFTVRLADRPASHAHPFGHGHIEFVSAMFEGGLVTLAALWILAAAAGGLIYGVTLRQLDEGLVVTAAAGAVNLLLGWWVVRRGRALSSAALVADGQHVLSDVWTTVAVLLGLGLVRWTGLTWLDPMTAAVAGLLLLWTGSRLVRESAEALLAPSDPASAVLLTNACASLLPPGVTGPLSVRALRAGVRIHAELVFLVPPEWTMREAESTSCMMAAELMARTGLSGDIHVRLRPRLNPLDPPGPGAA